MFKGFDSAKAASSRLEKLRLRIFMYPQMVSDLKSRGGERCLWFGTSPTLCEHNRSLLRLVIKKSASNAGAQVQFRGTLASQYKYK